MSLYPHNQKAAEAVLAAFQQQQRAAVVHATGTGKSYIIAAVVEHYDRVMVIAPNNFVLDETRKVCKEGVTFRTYASVLYDKQPETGFDLIVMDEFHRAGADKWSIGVQRLIDENPQAFLLGTSATHIRYLDNERNMADELFDGNVVSYLSLRMAIEQGILPNPTYVSSIYDFTDTGKEYEQRIKSCRRKNVDKENLCRQLKGIAHNWENAGGVPTIIRKYFDRDMQRIIVFCSKVRRAAAARHILSEWFGKAGFKRVRYYNIDYKEKRLEQEMQDFQAPMGDYDLKVAISVNMLNEGVHIPRVDGVIMMRSTVSRIIIEQQVGRCLTADNKGRTPVVLDLVNNMDLIRYDDVSFGEGKWDKMEKDTEDEDGKECGHNKFPFSVIDECRDIRVLLSQLDDVIYGHHTKEECMESAKKYTGRQAWHKGESMLYYYAYQHGWLDECCAHMKEILHHWTKEECIKSAKKYDTRKAWSKGDNKAYAIAKHYGWFDDCCSHMEEILHHWTKEECLESAKKYTSRAAWSKGDSKAYAIARHYGWFDDCCIHMVVLSRKWTKEECLESAKKYTSRAAWYKGDNKTYNFAKNHGWYDECCAHMKVLLHKWTKDECSKCAKKYSSRKAWSKGDHNIYNYAQKNGWLDECCAHMGKKIPTLNS